MRKATLFMALAALASAPSAQAAQQGPEHAMNPLGLLPGMHPHGASIPSTTGTFTTTSTNRAALPLPLVSEFTNVPNPFDSRVEATTLAFLLAQDSKVTLTVYDLLGVKVRAWTLPAGQTGAKAGANKLSWDGTNAAGQKVAKGGYLAQLDVEGPEGTATILRKIAVIH